MKEFLILDFNGKTQDLREKVYRKTLDYIASKLEAVDRITFIDNEQLLEEIKKHDFTAVISTCELSKETAFILKGAGLVQIIIGYSEDLEDICDIVIDPLMKESNKYLAGLKYLLPSVLDKHPSGEIARLLDMEEALLKAIVSTNKAEADLIRMTRLYEKLDWDSEFFGFNVGYISCLRLTPNIERHINKFIRKENIVLLEYLCNCHDRESVVTSEKNGYSFVDMRLTFERVLNDVIECDEREGFTVRRSKKEDMEAVKRIAHDIYKYSRYYFDSNFERDKVIEFYVNWAQKAVLGTFDDYAYVLENSVGPVGFCTIKKDRLNAARIGLFGLDPNYSKQGLAKHLLNSVLNKLKEEEKIDYVEVVTQGRNYEAQRLYEKCGFLTKSTQLWYHKWFH